MPNEFRLDIIICPENDDHEADREHLVAIRNALRTMRDGYDPSAITDKLKEAVKCLESASCLIAEMEGV